MADNAIDLNLLKCHIKERCSPTNIIVEEIDEEIIKTETEVFGGSWVHQNVDINEVLANEKCNLENSEEQLINENTALDTVILDTCRTSIMVDNNETDLKLLKCYIKEECSPTNIIVEEVDEEIIKIETEAFEGSWVYENVNINEVLANEKSNLENSEEQLINENTGITKKTFEDNSTILEKTNNLSTKRQKGHENGLDFDNANMDFDGEETVSQEDLIENMKINNKGEKFKFLHENDCVSKVITGSLKKSALVTQKNCEKDVLTYAKGKKQKPAHNNYKRTEKKYKCNECSYATARKCYLPSHIRSFHTMEKCYKCNECSYAAVRKCHLLSHIQSFHTMEKPYKCNECSYATVYKQGLLLHIQSHHTLKNLYKCNECSYATVRKCHLQRHIQSRHLMEKPYKCNECSYAAVNKSNLLTHIKSHHTMVKPYKCNECSYATVQKRNFLSHVKSRHTMEKSYKCNECSYAAVEKRLLLSHIKSNHTMQKPYKHNECSYSSGKK